MLKIFGTGNLTQDPEEIKTTTGKTVCKFTLAVNETYTKEDGTRPVQYFNVVAWGKLAENSLKYLKKGSKVSLYGNPQNRSYEASNGEKKYIFEIVATDIEFCSNTKAKEEKIEQQEMQPIDDDNLPF